MASNARGSTRLTCMLCDDVSLRLWTPEGRFAWEDKAMRLGVVAFLIAAMCAGSAWSADAVPADDARIKALADRDPMARRVAIQQLIEAGAPAVPALIGALDRGDPVEAGAALRALRAIAGDRKTASQRKEVSERLVAELAGQHSAGTRVVICGLLGVAGGAECVDPLYKLLMDTDVREAARQALIRIPSREATQALAAGLQITEGEFRVALVDAIGERKDPAALPIMSSLAIGPSERLSKSALKGLSRLATPGAVKVLAHAVEIGKPEALPALLALLETLAVEGLVDGTDKSASKALVAEWNKPDLAPGLRARIIDALGHFEDSETIDLLIKASNDSDAMVRAAAFKAMGRQGGDRAFDRLLDGIGRPAGPDRDAAEQALIDLAGNDVTARIRAAYEQAGPTEKGALLRILARRRAPGIDELLLNEAKNESPAIRAGAAGGLAFLAETRHESLLMQLAERGPVEVTQAAITGLLEIGGKLAKTDPSRAAGLYSKLYSLASAPEQANAALEGLAQTAGPEDIDMVDVLLPLMGEEEIAPEVCRAAARLAMHLPEDRREEATEILQAAVILSPNDPMRPSLLEHLWKLGGEFDPAHEEGFVTRWHLAGPFKIADPKSWNECPFSDAQPDVKAKTAIVGREYEWKAFHTPELNGVVPLAKTLGPGDEQAAYAYAEITVDATQQIRLLIGSDDGLVLWLNGKRILATLDERRLTVDQDRVDVDLVAGVNRLLIKSINLAGDWAFCLRMTDSGGQPLPFRQQP